MGSNSAVGVAVRKEVRMGREKVFSAWAMKDLRSVLEMPPILRGGVRVRNVGLGSWDGRLTGLRSALEQSYFVYRRIRVANKRFGEEIQPRAYQIAPKTLFDVSFPS
jgi:hypothetical protein